MDVDLFSTIGLVLSAWVLLSPGWRLAGLRRQRGPLEESLIENAQAENETDVTYWLPSWFFLSVAVMAFWSWFFWGAAKIPKSLAAGSWLWSDANTDIQLVILFNVIANIVWLVWLCFINYKKTLLCVAVETLGVVIVGGVALIWDGSVRLHFIGIVALALTVASNFCRMKSSAGPQFSKIGFTVAISGFLAGVLWFPKGFAVDYFSADAVSPGFLSMLFKKKFFWKMSSTAGSLFRGRDMVLLMIMLPDEFRNLQVKIEQNWLWFLQKVTDGSRSLQLMMGHTWLWFGQQVAASTDAQT